MLCTAVLAVHEILQSAPCVWTWLSYMVTMLVFTTFNLLTLKKIL